MARDWRDLFTVDGASPRGRDLISEDAPAAQERRRGMFRRLRENLRKTRQALFVAFCNGPAPSGAGDFFVAKVSC